jgi:serine/threonine protein kinase
MQVGVLKSSDPVWLGPYHLIGRLGMGSQGVVYLARDPEDKLVAVKTLHAGLLDDAKAAARFVKELDTARKVAPSCTAQVLAANPGPNQPYLVTEYIDGPSLKQAVRELGPPPNDELRRLAIATATALAAIHEAGVVHRDFNPANVLLGPDGPRVIDFGIASALDGTTVTTNNPIGTPSYMAPEQIAGYSVGPPADVFAWAGVTVFAATGRPPFGDDSILAIMERIMNGEPDLNGLPGPLRELVRWCLAKEPAERPTAKQICDQLAGGADAPAPPSAAAISNSDTPMALPRYSAARVVGFTVPPVSHSLASDSASDNATNALDTGTDRFDADRSERSMESAIRSASIGSELPRLFRPISWRGRNRLQPRHRRSADPRTQRRALATVAVIVAAISVVVIPAWVGNSAQTGKGNPPHRKDTDLPTLIGSLSSGKAVHSVAFGQLRGRSIALTGSVEEKFVRVWDLATNKQIDILIGHTDTIYSVAFGQLNGKPIALSGDEDRTLRIWDLTTGKQLKKRANRAIANIAVGQLGDIPIAVSDGGESGEDTTVRVSNLATGGQIFRFTGHTGPIYSTALGQLGGKPIAVSGDEGGSLRIWDLTTGKQLGEFNSNTGPVNSVAIGQLRNRTIAVTGSEDDETVRVWDLATGEQINRLTHGAVNAVAIGQLRGRVVTVTGSNDNSVRVWDLITGKQVNEFTHHTNIVKSVAIGQLNGKPIAISGSEDGTARVWNLDS